MGGIVCVQQPGKLSYISLFAIQLPWSKHLLTFSGVGGKGGRWGGGLIANQGEPSKKHLKALRATTEQQQDQEETIKNSAQKR